MTESHRPKIVVVGSINMDLVVRTQRMPRPGETIRGRQFLSASGGKGANQAVAAARLNAQVSLIARVGDDAFGRTLIDHLAHFGVDPHAIAVTDDCASGVAVISVDDSGENAITIIAGANARLNPGDVQVHRDLIADADVVLLQLESPTATVVAALELAQIGRAHV